MSEFLLSLLAFVAAISVLIAVHEFGHYWVARRLGVKVLRFSIGFGKPIWQYVGKDQDRVEYVISALPLGGYVKMLDEREGEVAEEELHRAFNRQPVAKRFAIVAAGPILNLIFAVVAYWLMFMHGVPGLKPVLGELPAGSPAAAAGLHSGDEIVAVGDAEVRSWSDVLEIVLPSAILRESVDLTINRGGAITHRSLPLQQLTGDEEQERLLEHIGLIPFRPQVLPIIDKVTTGSVAERAGLVSGDVITEIAGETITEWKDLVAVISSHPAEKITVTLLRNGAPLEVGLIPDAVEIEGRRVGRIGIAPVIPHYPDSLVVEVSYGPLHGFEQALSKTWDNSIFTLRMMGKMILGQVSVENLSGPIAIAGYAKSSAAAGISEFLRFLAIVSLSLGVLNLLPVPVLDGGHLAFYIVEIIKGSPVSERIEMVGQRIGLALIIALMTLALYNDLARIAR